MGNFYLTIIHRPEMVPEYIQKEAEQEPERVTSAPHTMPVRRLDDVRAAKQLDLTWKPTTQ